MSVKTNNKGKDRRVVFNMGQNSADEPTTLKNGFATLIENGIIDELGKIKQRGGTDRVGADDDYEGTDPVTGMYTYNVMGSLDTVVRALEGLIETLDDDNQGWTAVNDAVETSGAVDTDFLISGTVISGALISGTYALTSGVANEFIQAMDLLFMFNGGHNSYIMDRNKKVMVCGSGQDDVPKGLVAEWTNTNRLFVGGSLDRDKRDHVWFSDTLSPQLFDQVTNVIKFASGDADDGIVAIKQFRQSELIVYKGSSIFNLNIADATPSNWLNLVISKEIGCVAGRTVANLGDEHIFLARDGVRMLSRTNFDVIKNGVISKYIQDIIDRINWDRAYTSCAVYFQNRYILSVPVDGALQPNMTLIWDSQAAKLAEDLTAGWTVIPKNVWYPSCYTRFEFSDRTDALLYGDNRDVSLVFRAFTGKTDDGNAIIYKVDGPEHSIDNINEAVWYPLYCVFDSTDDTRVNILGSVNGKEFRQLSTIDFDQGVGVDLPVNLPISFTSGDDKSRHFINSKKLGRGRTFQVRILHDDLGKAFTFNEYTIFATMKGAGR